jgi:hypothetical protein
VTEIYSRLIAQNPVWKDLCALLCSVLGVGPVASLIVKPTANRYPIVQNCFVGAEVLRLFAIIAASVPFSLRVTAPDLDSTQDPELTLAFYQA